MFTNNFVLSAARLRTLPNRALHLAFLGFVFLCVSAPLPAHADPIPPGPYQKLCTKIKMVGTTLVATCKNFFNEDHPTQLNNATSCKTRGTIKDINGDLRCVVASNHVGGDHATDFDIVSIVSDTTVNGVETKVMRVDQPKVFSNDAKLDVSYPEINFKPGDRVTFTAGGCVQTGGSGRTWKRYINPTGPNAAALYSGTGWIPGVTGGGLEKVSGLMSCQPWVVPKPARPELEKEFALHLGYLDDNLSDNGYWGHDDGTEDQCKGVGPAFVQIMIVSSPPEETGAAFSPHCKPMDLTWDMNNEDANGLPLNPQWALQLGHPGEEPVFQDTWSKAVNEHFDRVYDVDRNLIASTITSQDPILDLYGHGLACPGNPLPGHVNWMIATYIGTVTWDEWSGYWPNDNDMNLNVTPCAESFCMKRNAGLVQGHGQGPTPNLVLEFDKSETVDNMGGPFWTSGMASTILNKPHPVDATWKQKFGGTQGLLGVVTGVIGVDSVHQGSTESHPVFALAVRTKETPTADGVQEHWAFFLRNSGDEGDCSQFIHFWDSPLRQFFIQLPWPEGATAASLAGAIDTFFWQQAKLPIGIELVDHQWTLIKVQQPNGVDDFGLDGELTVSYTVPGGKKKRAPLPPATHVLTAVQREPESHADAANRIADPAVKAKFIAARAALKPLTDRPDRPKVHDSITPAVTAHQHVAGAASHGKATRPRTVPNEPKQKLNAEMEKLQQTYAKELKLEQGKAATPPKPK